MAEIKSQYFIFLAFTILDELMNGKSGDSCELGDSVN